MNKEYKGKSSKSTSEINVTAHMTTEIKADQIFTFSDIPSLKYPNTQITKMLILNTNLPTKM